MTEPRLYRPAIRRRPGGRSKVGDALRHEGLPDVTQPCPSAAKTTCAHGKLVLVITACVAKRAKDLALLLHSGSAGVRAAPMG